METATQEFNLEKVAAFQGHGGMLGKKSLTIELHVNANRPFTENDKMVFQEVMDILQRKLKTETYRLNEEWKQEGLDAKNKLIELFGQDKIFVQEIENEYSKDIHYPWLIVTTGVGHIKLGWRKRVIHIDWSGTVIKEDAETIFPDEDVTKYEKTIHAWGYEPAQKYINKLLGK